MKYNMMHTPLNEMQWKNKITRHNKNLSVCTQCMYAYKYVYTCADAYTA